MQQHRQLGQLPTPPLSTTVSLEKQHRYNDSSRRAGLQIKPRRLDLIGRSCCYLSSRQVISSVVLPLVILWREICNLSGLELLQRAKTGTKRLEDLQWLC